MEEYENRLNELSARLDELLKKHDECYKEINELRIEIKQLRTTQVQRQIEEIKIETPTIEPPATTAEAMQDIVRKIEEKKRLAQTQTKPAPTTLISDALKLDIEKFIGENLINKIGIVITVIGVAIGAKYSIEHDLISPLTRIILGYLMGIGLLGFAIKLKKEYANFSAVLISGAIAILYFITFSAYSFYALIPQAVTFGLMVFFTSFTIVAAIHYNKQIIAHFGLVGAYAIPFLLSDGSGKVAVLFTYMAIINLGVLVIAFKKYWKPLYYSSFAFTWLIFIAWFTGQYEAQQHFELALVFLSIFFVTFYSMFLAYKMVRLEKFDYTDIVLLLANAFLFYGLGYAILGTTIKTEQLVGLFTLLNAVIHFIVTFLIYKQKLADRNLFFLMAGLVLVFITIAVPVQLNGNWVTMLWAGEAALLFWIGRTKSVSFYEKLSFPLMALAFLSIVQDWDMYAATIYYREKVVTITPIFNIHFLTSMLFVAAFAFINYIHYKWRNIHDLFAAANFNTAINYVLPLVLLVSVFYAFEVEIVLYWDQLYTASSMLQNNTEGYANTIQNLDLLNFKNIWLLNYAMLFFSILSFLNTSKLKNKYLGFINLGVNVVLVVAFLLVGLLLISNLRDSYLSKDISIFNQHTTMHIAMRYISLVFLVVLLVAIYKYVKSDLIKPVSFNLNIAFEILLATTILWVACSELISWLDRVGVSESYKLVLSILWGIYALILIAIGIWKNKKHLRIGAIALFAITLIKLFVYDISQLETIAKTIVFVSLGILLLVISFLYNKYKHLLVTENEK